MELVQGSNVDEDIDPTTQSSGLQLRCQVDQSGSGGPHEVLLSLPGMTGIPLG